MKNMIDVDASALLGNTDAGRTARAVHQANSTRRQTPDQPWGMTTKIHSKKSEIDRMDEENAVLDMRALGMTTRAIAARLNVTHTTVQNRLKAALARVEEPKVEELRKELSEQFDGLLNALELGIRLGDPKAINAAVGILDRKAKLFGVDAPTKHEIVVETEADRDIKDLLNQIAAASADTHEALATQFLETS